MEISKELPIGEIIKLVASQYIGEKEIPGNKGWASKALWTFMKPFWKYKDPWCADYFCAVWYKAYEIKYGEYPLLLKQLKKLFSASSIRLIKNFRNSNLFAVTKNPVIGAGYCWQYYKNGKVTVHGHTGTAVTRVIKTSTIVQNNSEIFYCEWEGVEGNASDKVKLVKRNNKIDQTKVFLGFIIPRDFNAKELERYTVTSTK